MQIISITIKCTIIQNFIYKLTIYTKINITMMFYIILTMCYLQSITDTRISLQPNLLSTLYLRGGWSGKKPCPRTVSEQLDIHV